MGQLTYYSNYLNNVNQSLNKEWRDLQQEFINEMIDNSTIVREDLYEEGLPFDFKFVSNPKCWIGTVLDVTTGMVKNSDDYRSLYFQNLEHNASRGRYYKWNNNYWLVYETTTNLETIATCNIRRCNNWLKWLTNKGEVIQYPCVIEGELTSANAQVAKMITQANSHIDIIVQGNVDTLNINKNTRCIFNGVPYKFYSINNYMQNNFVDKNTPLIYMDFYLDMSIDEDNIEENLANDIRASYIVECDVIQITGQKGKQGKITPTVYYHNNIVDNPRMEFISSNENIVKVDESGNYELLHNGSATITVQIKGNTVTAVEIPITVEDTSTLTYNFIINPIITSLKQGRNITIAAKVVDNLNNDVTATTVIQVIPSGTDGKGNYTLTNNGDNTWTLKNNIMSNIPLTLTFVDTIYGLSYDMTIKLQAMF